MKNRIFSIGLMGPLIAAGLTAGLLMRIVAPSPEAGTIKESTPLFQSLFSPLSATGRFPPSEACAREWRDLLALDFNTFGKFTHQGEAAFIVENPASLVERMKHFSPKRCGLEGDLEKDCSGPVSANACLRGSLEYRLSVADAVYRQRPVREISEIPVLTSLFFYEGKREQRCLPCMGALVKRILEIDPRHFEAARLAVDVAYADWRAASGESFPRTKIFQAALAYAESFARPDESLVRMRLREAVHLKDTSLLRSRANGALQSGLDNLGFYYLAMASYLEENIAGAQAYLSSTWLSHSKRQNLVAAIAWNRTERAAPRIDPNAFLDIGEEVSLRLADGTALGFSFLPAPERNEGALLEIETAQKNLTLFEHGLQHCQKENESTDSFKPLWGAQSEEMKSCLQQAFATWNTHAFDSLHLGAR